MCAFVKGPDGEFEIDEHEPPFSEDELQTAAYFLTVEPSSRQSRRDRCPHQTRCVDTETCIRNIAWYRRYQPEIERDLTERGLQP